MGDQSTSIVYDKVRSSVDTIVSCSTVMDNIFTDFGKEMTEVGAEDVFVGNASESLGERFRVLRQKFDSYTMKVKEFSDAISGAADATQATENKLASQAEDLAA